ncbi:MAG: S41 family peptidase [Armatimonadota bacterium]
MRADRRLKGVSLGLAVCASFILGALAGRGMTVVGSSNTMKLAELVPHTVQFQKALDVASPTDLRPLATFWEVREKIKRNFVYPITDDRKLTYGAIRGMLESLDDPYSRFMTPEEYKDFQSESERGQFSGIGAVLDRHKDPDTDKWQIVVSSILPEGPASKTALRPGDVIVGVDDKSVEEMPLHRVVEMIRGKAGTTVKLTVVRKGQADPLEIVIERGDVEVPAVEYEMLPGKIGYIWLRNFNRQAPAKMREALTILKQQGMKGLLLDLSLDPGGILDVAVEIADMFIDSGPLVWIQERGAEPEPLVAHKDSLLPADLPMVCLIDHSSASASEILAGCLQDTGRAVVVGQHSFGKSKVQTVIELNDQSALVLTTAVYLTPKKRDIGEEWAQGKRGVKPDVELTEAEPDAHVTYQQWHDQQKAKAVEVLRKQMAGSAAAG